MHYKFEEIEENWQKYWAEHKTFRATEDTDKPKYYVLDMFPYPSGAGLHVGHPLGYIASDVFARYQRLNGFEVLHPMGYDAFGLPAEQYAIQTGQHPAITTEKNIETYRRQLDQLGFSFDWDRMVKTCDPDYYKWTQWIFLQLFDSWYNKDTDKAEPISALREKLAAGGSASVNAVCDEVEPFTGEEWEAMTKAERNKLLLNYRLAYLSEAMVNWCPELGTVLANDEVKDGVSERGGHPVVQKKMQQWSMRITAYAQRLLDGLEKLDWSDSLKEIQRNWIGRSEGASVKFKVQGHDAHIEVFTTRPDTIFGVSFMVLAPEHELVDVITTDAQKQEIEAYKEQASHKSERDRMSDVKTVSGAFTGAFVEHPFTGEDVPIWIGDYVLASYGTGAVMAVPSGDQRDWNFAKHFGLPIPSVIEGTNVDEAANDSKEGTIINSDFLNGLKVPDAIKKAIEAIEEKGIGAGSVNYRLRDAVFGRQRYWGEPIPIYYEDGVPYPLPEDQLPLKLPEVDQFLPTEDGEPPLARAKDWTYEGKPLETTTMPGWAGSSWYYLRYMDPKNDSAFAGRDKIDYWQNVDLYIGGAEHATGHLLYVRFWTKFLYDRGFIPFDEPAKKLINQGMIQGKSALIYRITCGINGGDGKMANPIYVFIPKQYAEHFEQQAAISRSNYRTGDDVHIDRLLEAWSNQVGGKLDWVGDLYPIHVPIEMVRKNDSLDIERFVQVRPEYEGAIYIHNDEGDHACDREVEKMSKSKYNVVNPDDLCERYGADTMRLYEMFLGPLTESKPWDTKGIEGVHRFLKKLWRLVHDDNGFNISEEEPTKDEYKSLHRTIKKVKDDIERYSFNTVVSEYMICVNELHDLKCNKRKIIEPFVILLSPYAPHMAEELWKKLGHDTSVSQAQYPEFDASYLVEDSHTYPVSFNGKMRFTLELPASMSKEDIEKEVLAHETAQKWLDGKDPRKVIVVPKKIVNIVV